MRTSSPSVGLSGEVEEAVGEDEEEVEDGDEGEVTLLGLTSTSFFSFRSTCLLFVPEERERGQEGGEYKLCVCVCVSEEVKKTTKGRQLSLHSCTHTNTHLIRNVCTQRCGQTRQLQSCLYRRELLRYSAYIALGVSPW